MRAMQSTRNAACRALSILLSAVILGLAPGVGSYSALAQSIPVNVRTPLNGAGAAGASAAGTAGRV
ncbi:MAG: hypothetical protein FD126_3756, partial [Elusimicrobia bacterium]